MDRLGVEFLSVFGLPPVEFVNLAADLGCHYISTGLREHKFGIDIGEVEAVYARAMALPNIALDSVSCHIGSQLLDTRPMLEAIPESDWSEPSARPLTISMALRSRSSIEKATAGCGGFSAIRMSPNSIVAL